MTDGIPLDQIDTTNVPLGILSWPVRVSLSAVEFTDREGRGVRPISGAFRWPDVTPAGWDGPIYFSIWLFRQPFKGARWVGSCFLEFYRGKEWTGAPLNKEYLNWLGGIGKGYGTTLENLGNVVEGERIGFMLTAGSQRLKDTSSQPGQRSPQERSNILLVEFTANGIRGQVEEVPGTPTPQPPQPPPTNPEPLPPGIDTSTIVGSLNLLASTVDVQSHHIGQLTEAIATPQAVTMPTYTGRLVISGRTMRLPWPFANLELDIPIMLTPSPNPAPIVNQKQE